MAGIVIDSSVALSWCLPDEDPYEPDEVQNLIAEAGAVVPSLWHLEIANALVIAVRRGRVEAATRRESLRLLSLLPIETDGETAVRAWDDTLSLAESHTLSLYDATYLELAHRRDLPLATLDAALARAADAQGVPVL